MSFKMLKIKMLSFKFKFYFFQFLSPFLNKLTIGNIHNNLTIYLKAFF